MLNHLIHLNLLQFKIIRNSSNILYIYYKLYKIGRAISKIISCVWGSGVGWGGSGVGWGGNGAGWGGNGAGWGVWDGGMGGFWSGGGVGWGGWRCGAR